MQVRILQTTNVVAETSVMYTTNQLAHVVSAARLVYCTKTMIVSLSRKINTKFQRIGRRNRTEWGQ